jgi:hypothetical protein
MQMVVRCLQLPQESDKDRTIARAATGSMADGLAKPPWFNVAKVIYKS